MHHLIHGVVALQQLQRAALAEDGTQRLVLAREGQPHQPVPAAQMRYFPVRGSTAPSQKLPCFTAQICSATTLMMRLWLPATGMHAGWRACGMNLMLHGTHHSSRLMGGGGLMGSMRTTEESTLGGGRKLFLPTCSRVAMSGHCGSSFACKGAYLDMYVPQGKSIDHRSVLFIELAPPHLEQMAHARQQLRVDRQPAVHRIACRRFGSAGGSVQPKTA